MIAEALETLPGFVLSVFLVFCRIGSCLMLIPVFGSARVPVQVRLMLCLRQRGISAFLASSGLRKARLRLPLWQALRRRDREGIIHRHHGPLLFCHAAIFSQGLPMPSALAPWKTPRRMGR